MILKVKGKNYCFGAFKDFEGTVEEINPDDATVKVKIFMFGDRETLLELEMSQIRKVD